MPDFATTSTPLAPSTPIHHIRRLDNDDAIWNLLAQDPNFPLYRKKIWKDLVEETFGHVGVYLAAFNKGVLADVMPFFLVIDPLGRKRLISTPYQGSNGGFLSADPGLQRSLIKAIIAQARQLGVKYAEVRSDSRLDTLADAGFVAHQPLIVSVVPLASEQDNWSLLSAHHRRNVRLAQRDGVSIATATEWEQMCWFAKELSAHYKGLGVPFLGENFFRAVWDRLLLAGHAELHLAMRQGEPVGGHLMFFNGRTLVSKFSVTYHEGAYAKCYAAYALYWEAIKLGTERGFSAFDLGITGEMNAGLRDFKARLGAEEKPLYFYYYRLAGALPNYERYYSSFRLARSLWRWAPTALTSLIGPQINNWIC